MSGPYILKVGDKVTFGHTNGYKLKAGDYAKQPNSEFQFIVSVQYQWLECLLMMQQNWNCMLVLWGNQA